MRSTFQERHRFAVQAIYVPFFLKIMLFNSLLQIVFLHFLSFKTALTKNDKN